MHRIRFAILSAALLATAATASAQDAPRKPFIFGMTANHMAMDPAAAAAQNIGASSWGMQFDGGYSFGRHFVVAADFAPHILSDKAGFTQATTAGDMSSSAMLMYFSAMAGTRTTPFHLIPGLGASTLGVFGGASLTQGERSIDKCVDCTTEKITVKGGSFVQPTITFGEGNARLRLSDRYYLGGSGIRSVISAGMEFGGL